MENHGAFRSKRVKCIRQGEIDMWRNINKTKSEIMPLLSSSNTLIIFDTETTGLGKAAKIIQFSAVKYSIDEEYRIQPIEMLDLYINPEEPLSEKIIELTGITNQILMDAKTEDVQYDTIRRFMESADLWAAYNCSFDLRMIDQMNERVGKKIGERPYMDLLKIARDLIPYDDIENYKLKTVFEYLFPNVTIGFHNSIEDVKATGMCFQHFINTLATYTNDCSGKMQAYLEWAAFTVNPRAKSQKRIKLKLNLGEYGDIFWDVVKMRWSSKSDAKAKKLFESLDIGNLEQQLLNKYAWRFKDVHDVESLAKAMEKAKKRKKTS